jgi:hypothetical protein
VFCVYALMVFEWRRRKILRRDPGGYDDPLGPALLTMALLAALVGVSYVAWEDTVKGSKATPTIPSKYSLFPPEYTTFHVSNSTLTSFPLTGARYVCRPPAYIQRERTASVCQRTLLTSRWPYPARHLRLDVPESCSTSKLDKPAAFPGEARAYVLNERTD